jgi:hypothetical protein
VKTRRRSNSWYNVLDVGESPRAILHLGKELLLRLNNQIIGFPEFFARFAHVKITQSLGILHEHDVSVFFTELACHIRCNGQSFIVSQIFGQEFGVEGIIST